MVLSTELGLILLFSILGGVLAVRFRQPSVLGLIIVGALVGPNVFGFVQDKELINISIEIGAILLLFTVGIEFSLQNLIKVGIKGILLAIFKLGLVFILSYYTSIFFGIDFILALYIAVILSITSTVIFMKILEQKGMAKRGEIPLLIAVLIIEDIYGVFALTFFSGLNTQGDLQPLNLVTELLFSMAVLIVAYMILKRAIKPIIDWLIKYKTDETITFVSLGLCGAMSYLAYIINLSPSVGAFLAGNMVASLPQSKSFDKSIHPFILTFTSLFFFSVGTIVNFSVLKTSLFLIIVLILVNIISKFLAIGYGSYILSNFSGKQAVFSGIAMVSVGEFSLLIAKEASGLGFNIDLVSITSIIILVSSIAMSFLLNKNDQIYNSFLRHSPQGLIEKSRATASYINNLSWKMLASRINTATLLPDSKRILKSVLVLLAFFITGFFVWRLFTIFYPQNYRQNIFFIFAIGALLIGSIFPIITIFRNISDIFAKFPALLRNLYPSNAKDTRTIIRNFFIIMLLFIVVFSYPGVSLIFGLHPIFNVVWVAAGAVIVYFGLKSAKIIISVVKSNRLEIPKLRKVIKPLVKNTKRLK
ncbi:MAG TPA: cation:proton antiporter [Candidatus Nanoarchaeia archaeon]|nr:cation:proton antiporter [Candidatus Nanoarchaeia archaeon]